MERSGRCGRFWMTAAVNTAILLFCVYVVGVRPENNDDYLIHTVLGLANGESSYLLATVNAGLARLVAWMQSVLPAVNWFTVIEFALLWLGFTGAGAAIWNRRPGGEGLALCLVFLLMAAPPMYLINHYTKYAIWITAAGGIMLLESFYAGRITRLSVLGFVTAVAGSLLRFSAFAAGLAALLPLALLFMQRKSEARRLSGLLRSNARGLSGFALLCLMAIACAVASGAASRATPEGEAFMRYYNARVRVVDYPVARYEDNEAAFEAIGITQNDLAVIESWNFADPALYSAGVFEKIAEIPAHDGGAFHRFAQAVRDAAGVPAFWLSAAMAVAGVALTRDKRRWLLLGLLAWGLGLLLGLSVFGRVTRWVVRGLVTALAGAGALLLSALLPRGTGKSAVGRPLCCLSVAAAVLVSGLSLPARSVGRDVRSLYAVCEAFARREETLYLFSTQTMPGIYERQSPFAALPADLFRNIYVLGGWDTQTASKNSALRRYHIEGSVYRALVEREDVLLADTGEVELLARLVREHVSPQARYSLVDCVEGVFVFAFASQAPPAVTCAELAIEEVGSEPYIYHDGYVSYHLRISGADRPVCAVWYVFEKETGERVTYQAAILSQGDGVCLATAAVPLLDVPEIQGCALRAVVRTQDGQVLTGPLFART